LLGWDGEYGDTVPPSDRHVLAAALAAEATVLCTSNTKDFPASVVEPIGIDVVTPDQLLSRLVAEQEPQMLAATAPATVGTAAPGSEVHPLIGLPAGLSCPGAGIAEA
jgi:hypothetical protein